MNHLQTSAEIQAALDKLCNTGGKVYLPVGCYPLDAPLVIDIPSSHLQGEVWAYNLDPNGVFETPYGTKLRLKGKDHPAVSIGVKSLPAGAMVSDLGIQGDILGMDTRKMFDCKHPSASAGLYLGGQRVDQGDFSKVSCCGLACAVSIAENAEIDACDFRKINMDGCCVGVYFAPAASYYAHFNRCVIADTPSYGFFADGSNSIQQKRGIHNVDITDIHFVRNCGANHLAEEPAAVYLKQISRCAFRDNIVDAPGTFWYYERIDAENYTRQVYKTTAIGLYIIGNQNRIFNNVFLHSSRESIRIEGSGNVLMCNVVDSDVILDGENNTVNALSFSTDSAKLILKGAAADSTMLFGVDESRVVRLHS